MIAVMYPLFIVAIIPVIGIEAYVVARRLKRSKRSVWKSVAVANGASMLLGYPLTWLISLSGWLIVEAIGWLMDKLHLPLWHWLSGSGIGGILLVPFTFAWLSPSVSLWEIVAAALLGLIPAFYVSWWLEAKIFQRMLALDRTMAKDASFYANAMSYALLVLIVLGYGSVSIIEHAWR